MNKIIYHIHYIYITLVQKKSRWTNILYCFSSTYVACKYLLFTFMLGNEGAQETACSTAIETKIPAKTENLWLQVFNKVSREINIDQWKSVIRHLLGKFCLLIAYPVIMTSLVSSNFS